MTTTPYAKFPRERRLRKAADFQRVKATGRRFRYPALHFMVAQKPEAAPPARLGLVVSKRVGNAVERNTVKRRCREAFRHATWASSGPYDVVVIAQPMALELDSAAVQAAFARLGREIGKVAGALAKRAAIRQGAESLTPPGTERRPPESP